MLLPGSVNTGLWAGLSLSLLGVSPVTLQGGDRRYHQVTPLGQCIGYLNFTTGKRGLWDIVISSYSQRSGHGWDSNNCN